MVVARLLSSRTESVVQLAMDDFGRVTQAGHDVSSFHHLAQASIALAPAYGCVAETADPFGWIRSIGATGTLGQIGENLVTAWCSRFGLSVLRSPNREADRIIEGRRVEIKFAPCRTRHAVRALFRFFRLRDMEYDVALLIGLDRRSAWCWVVPKDVLMSDPPPPGVVPFAGGRERALHVYLDCVPAWLDAYGGRIGPQTYRLLKGDCVTTNGVPGLVRGGYQIGDDIYPRVSSILGVMAKPGIEGWQRKVGFEEADRIRDSSTTFGSLVHKACERVALGAPAERVITDLERGGDLSAAQCVRAFARWLDSAVSEVLATERVVWSDRYRYAGTTDLLVELQDGRRAVADIKTSKSLSESYRVQLEAYRLALEEQGEDYDARMVVWLPSTHPGLVAIREYDDHAADRYAWKACLALHRFMAACRDDWRRDKDLLIQAEMVSA